MASLVQDILFEINRYVEAAVLRIFREPKVIERGKLRREFPRRKQTLELGIRAEPTVGQAPLSQKYNLSVVRDL
jgi:hypothetical protein